MIIYRIICLNIGCIVVFKILEIWFLVKGMLLRGKLNVLVRFKFLLRIII